MPDMPLDTPASSAALRPLIGLEKFAMHATPEDHMPLAPSWSTFWVVLMLWSVSAGLLVPDIPLEETGDIRRIATAAGLELVLLATPTTPEDRMRAIAEVSQGFVYLVSVAGASRVLPVGACGWKAWAVADAVQMLCSFAAYYISFDMAWLHGSETLGTDDNLGDSHCTGMGLFRWGWERWHQTCLHLPCRGDWAAE